MPIRVLYLLNSLRQGGMERDVSMYCQHIARDRVTPELLVFLGDGELRETVEATGTPIHCVPRQRAYDPRFAIRFARAIAKSPVDLVHAVTPACAVYAGLAQHLFRMKTPTIYTEGTSILPRGLQLGLQQFFFPRFRLCIANSPASRQKLLDEGVPASRIVLVPNGHDMERFRIAREVSRHPIRESLGVGDDEYLLFSCGRLIPTKRYPDLLEAFARLRGTTERPIRLAIAGDGPIRSELESVAESLDLGDTVQFLGMRKDILQLHVAADLFVFPSEVEGLPNAVLEAVLMDRPVVAMDIPGVRYIYDGCSDIDLVTPRDVDGLVTAITRHMTGNGTTNTVALRQRAEQRFSIENTMVNLYDAYSKGLDRAV